MTLEARASLCAISGAPYPRAWPISGAPQTDATGKQSGFQLLGILLLLRENTTKLVRPRARFDSGFRGLKCTKARRSGFFLGLVDRGGGSCIVVLELPSSVRGDFGRFRSILGNCTAGTLPSKTHLVVRLLGWYEHRLGGFLPPIWRFCSLLFHF